MRTKAFRVIAEAIVWLAVYLLPFFVTDNSTVNFYSLFNIETDLVHKISTLLLIGYTYLNYRVLVPVIYLQRRYILYALLVAGCLLLVIWLPTFFKVPGSSPIVHDMPPLPPPGSGPPSGPPPGGPPSHTYPGDTPTLISKASYNVILFVISTFVAISIRQQRQVLELQKEKLDVELSFLKAQINPHFLFNTLNSIYALAIQKSADTPTAIVQLSELMRYLLKDSDSDTVPLSKELAYIDNYVALQKRRLGNTVHIEYEAPRGIGQQKIAPLIIMSFIENAFKHGVNPDQDSAIRILITLQGSNLVLFVTNNKVVSANDNEPSGIGLKNVVARLKRLYPARNHLKIEEDDKTYTVNLTLGL